MNRAERRAANARARNPEFRRTHRIKLTRPRDPPRLIEHHRRFEVVFWLTLSELGVAPYDAGYLTMMLLGQGTLLPAESVQDVFLVIPFQRVPHPTPYVHQAQRIRDRAHEFAARAVAQGARGDGADLKWLAASMAHLIEAIAADLNSARAKLAFGALAQLGWGEVLIEVRRRWASAMRSNFPPHTEPLSRAVRAAVAKLKLNPPMRSGR